MTNMIKLVLILSFLSLNSLAYGSIDFETYEPQGVDRTSLYQDYMLDNNDHDIENKLKNYHIILVKGIMANYVDALGNLILKKFGQYQYFDEQMKWFKDAHISYSVAKIDSEDSSLKNSIVVEKAILSAQKPVILLTHSKGGIDTLVALLRNSQLMSRIRGILMLQTPILGTPVADYIHSTQPWKQIAYIILKMMGGSGESLRDLSTQVRVEWYNQNKLALDHIARSIPTLAFSSWKKDIPNQQDCLFEFPRNLMEKNMGVESDGLVPWKSGVLPGTNYVAVEGLDHATPVSKNKYINLDRVKYTKALLNILLNLPNTTVY